MKKILLLSALSFIVLNVSYAERPTKCPSVAHITAVGVDHFEIKDGLWRGKKLGQRYDTNIQWDFMLGRFEADNLDDAKTQINYDLTTLFFGYGPIVVNDQWYCEYYTEGHHYAAARSAD